RDVFQAYPLDAFDRLFDGQLAHGVGGDADLQSAPGIGLFGGGRCERWQIDSGNHGGERAGLEQITSGNIGHMWFPREIHTYGRIMFFKKKMKPGVEGGVSPARMPRRGVWAGNPRPYTVVAVNFQTP